MVELLDFLGDSGSAHEAIVLGVSGWVVGVGDCGGTLALLVLRVGVASSR